MSLRATLEAWWCLPDPRPVREIEDEIAEELEHHLALRTQEKIDEGLSPREARAAAEALFGDVDRIRRACRRAKLGDRIMLQRINAVAVVLLLAAVVALGWRSYASEARSRETVDALREEVASLTAVLREGATPEVALDGPAFEELVRERVDPIGALGAEVRREGDRFVVVLPDGVEVAEHTATEDGPDLDPEAWLDRFRAAEGWRAGLALGQEIAALPADDALNLMRAIYRRIPSVEHRQQILKPFVFHGGHPHAVEVLHLAATDLELDVQRWALGYLKSYAYRDFGEDYDAYLDWYGRYGGRPLSDVLLGSAAELVERLRDADDGALRRELDALDRLDLRPGGVADVDLAAELRRLGALDVMRRGLASHDAELRAAALRFAASCEPGEAFLREAVLPVLESENDAELLSSGARALGASGDAWATEPLVELARRRLATGGDGVVFAVGQALAELGDARAIRSMIGLIDAHGDYWSVYGLGHFGLAELTGVAYDEAHDGAWWRAWWARNRERVGADASALEIPTYALER